MPPTPSRVLRRWLADLPANRRATVLRAVAKARHDPSGFVVEVCAREHAVTVEELASLFPDVERESRIVVARVQRRG
ncbi:MAG: hypothetical protein JNM94_01675 [Phycisphaerae bacterium]|nr:hypothetical protein [Phycisphaerae bacterium]